MPDIPHNAEDGRGTPAGVVGGRVFLGVLVAVLCGLGVRQWREAARVHNAMDEIGGSGARAADAIPDSVRLAYREEHSYTAPEGEMWTALAVGPEDAVFVAAPDRVRCLRDGWSRRLSGEAGIRALAVSPDSLYAGGGPFVWRVARSGEGMACWSLPREDSYVTSLALVGEEIWVADMTERCVWRLAPNGESRGRIPGHDAGAGRGLLVPSPYFDVAASDAGAWLVDPGRRRVLRTDSAGIVAASWGESSSALTGFCGCCNPSHIYAVPGGALATAEKGLPRVKVYDRAGILIGLVAGTDKFTGPQAIRDLAVDRQGRILVLDGKQNAVRVFAPQTTAHIEAQQ